jgi:hypothetical protein
MLIAGILLLLSGCAFGYFIEGDVALGVMVVSFLIGVIVALCGFTLALIVLIRRWRGNEE